MCDVITQAEVTSKGHFMASKCQAVIEVIVLVESPLLKISQSLLHK